MARAEPERFDALESVGFKVERFGDVHKALFERMGGHYMDTGASAKIAEGLVIIDIFICRSDFANIVIRSRSKPHSRKPTRLTVSFLKMAPSYRQM